MNRKNLIPALFYGAVLLATSAIGEAAATFTLGPDSSLWLTGDSTLHPYTCKTVELVFTKEIDTAPSTGVVDLWDAVLKKSALKHLRLTIPVKSLKSKESALDKNMYKALKAKDYPEIVYDLSSYEVKPSTTSSGTLQVIATGSLTVADTTQPMALVIDVTSKDTELRLQGHYTLQMTQYGITPPTLMFGAIKVRDPVDIHFDLRWQAVKNE